MKRILLLGILAGVAIGWVTGGLPLSAQPASFPVQLSAGTASIGVLGANSGVDIGDVTINNASGASAVNIQDGGNSITVDGSVTADTEITTAAALADNTANPTVGGLAAFLMCFDGTTWDRCLSSAVTEHTGDASLTQSSAIGGVSMLLSKDFDGSALPQTVTAEGEAVIGAATLSGVQYVMMVSEDGALERGTTTTPLVVDIAASDTLATVTSLTQFNGNAIATNAGANSAGTLRVTIGTDDEINDDIQALVDRRSGDPCSYGTKVHVAIDQTSGEQLFAGTASNRTYVCHINVVTATAQNIALVSGTGTVCATSTGPMMGGTTAAAGWNFAANGGIALGAGSGTLAKSDTDADNVCLLQSGSGQISGSIVYVVAPN